MITARYARTMAAYNEAMNRRIYDAAGRLDEAARHQDRGALWRSIHGTLSHLYWGDASWMARLDGWPAPLATLAESGEAYPDFAALSALRREADAGICGWARDLTDERLTGDLTWFSGAAGCEMTMPRAIVVMHVFHHQTHHRGQVHAMLTAAGEATGATDLPLVLRDALA